MSDSKSFNGKRNKLYIIIFLVMFSLLFAVYSAKVYADDEEDDVLVIDPESLSVEYEKTGNVLAEYGFAVFTEESMKDTQAIKDKRAAEQKQMVSGLFTSEWDGKEKYDKDVRKVIEAGNLFETVNTGVEIDETVTAHHRVTARGTAAIMSMLLACFISAAVISWKRKKHESDRYFGTR